jgi:DNA (cytosine-5)-methyltransferase 1
MSKKVKDVKKKLNVLDLFCGCGGMTTGLTDAGLNVVAGIDIWDKAIESYESNHDHLAICEDLKQLSPESFEEQYDISPNDIDVIVGGPPCQGFSIAGKRDKKDPRNSLFMEYCKYLDYFKPKAFIMENVMGILSMKMVNGTKVIDIIVKKLEKNYNLKINKLYASDFEVPQNRRRVIIIGIRKDLKIKPPEIKPVGTVLEKRKNIDDKYYLSDKAIAGIKAKKERMLQDGKGFGAQFLKMDSPSYTIPARYWKDGYDALVKYDDDKIRRLTTLELKRIQTFPDNYILVGNNKEIIMQIGNAVACRFAYHLGKYIIKCLKDKNVISKKKSKKDNSVSDDECVKSKKKIVKKKSESSDDNGSELVNSKSEKVRRKDTSNSELSEPAPKKKVICKTKIVVQDETDSDDVSETDKKPRRVVKKKNIIQVTKNLKSTKVSSDSEDDDHDAKKNIVKTKNIIKKVVAKKNK